jgi:hypothetical protein
MEIKERWVSAEEQARREKEREEQAAEERAAQEWHDRYRREDPLYLRVAEFLKRNGLTDCSIFVGGFGEESSTARVYLRGHTRGASADIEWGIVDGQILLTRYDSAGNHPVRLEYPLDEGGMERALSVIEPLFRG